MNSKHLRRGSALVMALGIFTISAMIAGSLLFVSTAGSRLTHHRADRESAFQIAEAGAHLAVQAFADGQKYKGQGDTKLGDGTFSVTVNDVAGSSTQKEIISVGKVRGGEGMLATRKLRVIVDSSSTPPIGNYALISKGPLSFSGGALVDSYPKPNVGDVHANGDVTMSGGVTISGSLTSTGKIKSSGSAGATGGSTQYAGAVDFPPLDAAGLIAQAKLLGTTTGNVTRSGSGTVHVSGFVDGDITISGGGKLIVDGLVYVSGKVTFSGSAYTGSGTIVAAGDITISGGSSFNRSETNNLALVTLSTSKSAMTLSGGASVGGAVYCPYGRLTVSGSANVFGSVASNTVTMSGKMNITRNTDFQWPTIFGHPHAIAWQELQS